MFKKNLAEFHKTMNKNRYYKDIKNYGEDILESDEFETALNQTHHSRTSVAKHSVLTAAEGLRISRRLEKMGIKVDEKKVVRLALLHDFGILGRKEKFRNNYQCWREHPRDSLAIAKKLWPEIDEAGLKAISRHMWPLSLKSPTDKEGMILCLADKEESIKDFISDMRKKKGKLKLWKKDAKSPEND